MKKNDSLPKSTSFIIKLLVLFIIMISSITVNSQNNECKATLIVKNNENSKKAGESGMYYALTLTNKENQQAVFTIAIENNLAIDSNLVGKLNKKMVKLDGQFYNMNLEKIGKKTVSGSDFIYNINLKSGESFDFYVKLNVPAETEIGSINSSTVNVTSKNCNNFILSAILNTEIIDSE
jgi:hypothetical protein